MLKCKFALFLFICFVLTLIAVDSVSAAEDNKLGKLECESYIGDIPLDWREGYRGEVVEQPNGVYQAECRYPYNYVYGTPRDYASILVLWCEDGQCGDFTSYSREFGNPVESKEGKQALVVEKVTWPDHPQFINASPGFQEAKMKLLEQADARAISKEVKTTEDKKVSLTLEHVPPVFGTDYLNGGKIIVTVLDEENEPMPYMNVLIGPDVGFSNLFKNRYGYIYDLRIENHQKQLGLTENNKAQLLVTNATGQATWSYSRNFLLSETDFYLDSAELGELLFEKAKSNEPVEVEGTIQAWCFEYEEDSKRDSFGKLEVGKIHANAAIPIIFTHVAEISKIGATDDSSEKVRVLRIDLDSWQSFDIIRGSRAVVPDDLPYKLIPGDTVLLDENDIITVEWINGKKTVIKTKTDYLERIMEETGEPAQAHITIMYGDLGAYRAMKEVTSNPVKVLGIGGGIAAVGLISPAAAAISGWGMTFFGLSDHFVDNPLVVESKSTILIDFDEYEEKATVYTVEGTATLYNVKDGSTIDVTTGHKATVSPDGEVGSVTGFDESELNEDIRTILDNIRGEDTVMSMKKGLVFESRNKASRSSVQIPLTLHGVQDSIGNMDMTLRYDSSVLEATEVIKGGLTSDSMFDYNIIDGTIKISFAVKDGFSGDGSVAYVRFDVIGSEGSSSPLDIVSLSANRADDMASLNISDKGGVFKVIGQGEGIGDNDGDGKLTALDALAALQMAVGKRPVDLAMDMNGDGSVTSIDARSILKNAVG